MQHSAPRLPRARSLASLELAWPGQAMRFVLLPLIEGRRAIESGLTTEGTHLAKRRLECDLEHDRPRAAAVRVEIKSTRASKPGHPMSEGRCS